MFIIIVVVVVVDNYNFIESWIYIIATKVTKVAKENPNETATVDKNGWCFQQQKKTDRTEYETKKK